MAPMSEETKAKKRNSRILAICSTLRHVHGIHGWRSLITAVLIVYARDGNRLHNSASILRNLRVMAIQCQRQLPPEAIVYSVLSSSDMQLEWAEACGQLTCKLPATSDPQWCSEIQDYAFRLASLRRPESNNRVSLDEALSLINPDQEE